MGKPEWASRQRAEARAFRKAQRDLFKTAREYAFAVLDKSKSVDAATALVEDLQDELAEAAVDFAFAAARYAEVASLPTEAEGEAGE